MNQLTEFPSILAQYQRLQTLYVSEKCIILHEKPQ